MRSCVSAWGSHHFYRSAALCCGDHRDPPHRHLPAVLAAEIALPLLVLGGVALLLRRRKQRA